MHDSDMFSLAFDILKMQDYSLPKKQQQKTIYS